MRANVTEVRTESKSTRVDIRPILEAQVERFRSSIGYDRAMPVSHRMSLCGALPFQMNTGGWPRLLKDSLQRRFYRAGLG